MMLAEVTLPIGQWAVQVVGFAAPIAVTAITAVVAFAGRELPGWLVSIMRENITQKRIERAVHWAVTQIDHELVDPVTGQYRVVSVETGNMLADYAMGYAVNYTPEMAAQLGERLKPRILAEIAKIGMAPAQPLRNPLPAAPLPQLTK